LPKSFNDICHFCSKRVYVMERLSAEGYFFHRECFRCDVCNCTLRLGGHTFDSQERKFYCKIHYAQRQYSTSWGRFRRTTVRWLFKYFTLLRLFKCRK
uniref:LIM zinc-binding domain-containing protein n=1 Tax=Xiphophorus couchianus TaxID=32473 RepID=A0A3B5N1R1_9TELE